MASNEVKMDTTEEKKREVIIIDGDEVIELDENGMEVRSDEEEPTQSDLDFIAPDDEVEAEVLLSQTVCEEIDADLENDVDDIDDIPLAPLGRITRQASIMPYGVGSVDDDMEDDEDYVPDSGDEADDDYVDSFSGDEG